MVGEIALMAVAGYGTREWHPANKEDKSKYAVN
jgi:hypothetical protein